MLTMTALLLYVLKLPGELVFGRILPGHRPDAVPEHRVLRLARVQLAKKTGRNDVCALPSGISVPHMFIVVFVIMLPIAAKTGDPIKGWEAGLTWVFVQSFVLMVGGFVAPIIRKITPRAALLGALAGVSIAFISLRPALDMYMDPLIGVVCFAILLASWFRRRALLQGHPGWPGGHRGRRADRLGLDRLRLQAWRHERGQRGPGVLQLSASRSAAGHRHVFSGFEFIGIILVTAIPFGIYDLVEAMDNVESAEVGGDSFPTTRVLTADGVVSLIGCLMGNPFINAVYIGHPGWKAIGGRIGYSAATGAMVLVLSWFGVLALLMALIPVVAISPILLYIGMLIGAQAFQETPKSHAPAVILALVPQVAAGASCRSTARSAPPAPTPRRSASTSSAQVGVLYHGLECSAAARSWSA
jgi:AGZA family xanthine/uracil permease-like MFS transporter